MFLKVVILFALCYVVTAKHAHSSQHVLKHDGHHKEIKIVGHDKHGHKFHHIDYITPPKYKFAYKVKDPHTHDVKEQHEHRVGDVVKGYYSLKEPDGTIRHVHYHADHHSGFHADVKHSIHHIKPKKHHHHHHEHHDHHEQHDHHEPHDHHEQHDHHEHNEHHKHQDPVPVIPHHEEGQFSDDGASEQDDEFHIDSITVL